MSSYTDRVCPYEGTLHVVTDHSTYGLYCQAHAEDFNRICPQSRVVRLKLLDENKRRVTCKGDWVLSAEVP